MRIHVILPDELVRDIDELVGQRNRSRFLAEAARQQLKRHHLLQAIDDLADALDETAPPEWASSESAAAWVRRGRREDPHRLSPGDAKTETAT